MIYIDDNLHTINWTYEGLAGDIVVANGHYYYRLTASTWAKLLAAKRRGYNDLGKAEKDRLTQRILELKARFAVLWPAEEFAAAEAVAKDNPAGPGDDLISFREWMFVESWAETGRGCGKKVEERYDSDLLKKCWDELAAAAESEEGRVRAWFEQSVAETDAVLTVSRRRPTGESMFGDDAPKTGDDPFR